MEFIKTSKNYYHLITANGDFTKIAFRTIKECQAYCDSIYTNLKIEVTSLVDHNKMVEWHKAMAAQARATYVKI